MGERDWYFDFKPGFPGICYSKLIFVTMLMYMSSGLGCCYGDCCSRTELDCFCIFFVSYRPVVKEVAPLNALTWFIPLVLVTIRAALLSNICLLRIICCLYFSICSIPPAVSRFASIISCRLNYWLPLLGLYWVPPLFDPLIAMGMNILPSPG